MDSKEINKILIIVSIIIAIITFISSLLPIVYFLVNFSIGKHYTPGKEIFGEFIFGFLGDLVLSSTLFFVLLKAGKSIFNTKQYFASISKTKFVLIYKKKIIKEISPKLVFTNCFKNSKIASGIICITDNIDYIFIKLENRININLVDMQVKNIYTI